MIKSSKVLIYYVKIDVEGGEIGVLRGGRDFLARHRPILLVEYGQPSYAAYGHTADTLYEEAMMLGYAVCDLFGNVRSIDEWRACVDRLYWDYLLIPRTPGGHRGGACDHRSPSRRRVAPTSAAVGSWPAACPSCRGRSSGGSNCLISQRSQ